MKATIRARLLLTGAKALKEWGYSECTTENILTVMIYRKFFASMLEDTKGSGDANVEAAIDGLLAEIKKVNLAESDQAVLKNVKNVRTRVRTRSVKKKASK